MILNLCYFAKETIDIVSTFNLTHAKSVITTQTQTPQANYANSSSQPSTENIDTGDSGNLGGFGRGRGRGGHGHGTSHIQCKVSA